MRFDASMQARMDQRMILAPRMIQAMEILQLPLLALERRIDEELVKNPVLEMRENEAEETPPGGEQTNLNVAETERELTIKDDQNQQEEFARLDRAAEDWQEYKDYFAEDGIYHPSPRRLSEEADQKSEAIQNAPAPTQTLHEYLTQQLAFVDAEPHVKEIAGAIIRNLDDNGYLRIVLEEALLEVNNKPGGKGSIGIEEAEKALRIVQQLDPLGVGARDLRECLLIQLRAKPGYNLQNLEVRLVQEHLHDIENNRYPQLAQEFGISIEDIKSAVERIRKLNPKPGSAISATGAPHILPDVRVRRDDPRGDYRVEIADGRTPHLRISKAYRLMLKQKDLDGKARDFIQHNIRSARWLLEAVNQRRSTLQRVVQAIVKHQRDFFDRGPEHIQPLKMQQVAKEVSLHVGTISRAVDDKYADTPWGIVPLRNFFTGGTQTSEGDTVSWDRVKLRLKEMIDAEDKSSPLKDEQIVKMFEAEGINLARRTVAKYRKILKIPSARRRRQF